MPRSSSLKINFDVAVFRNEDRVEISENYMLCLAYMPDTPYTSSKIRVFIREHQMLVIVSLSQNIALPHSMAEVKAMVAVRALEFFFSRDRH